jgi:hypothetical protein
VNWDPNVDGPFIRDKPVWLKALINNLAPLFDPGWSFPPSGEVGPVERQRSSREVEMPAPDQRPAPIPLNVNSLTYNRQESMGQQRRRQKHVPEPIRRWICVCIGSKDRLKLKHVEVNEIRVEEDGKNLTDQELFRTLRRKLLTERRKHWYWHIFRPVELKKIEYYEVRSSLLIARSPYANVTIVCSSE